MMMMMMMMTGLCSRSRRLSLETYQRLVSVSSQQKLPTSLSREDDVLVSSRSQPFTSRAQDQFLAKSDRKPVCDFKLNNTKVNHISYRFPVVAQYLSNYHLWQRVPLVNTLILRNLEYLQQSYTVSGKKGATLFFDITLPNPNQYSKFFYPHT